MSRIEALTPEQTALIPVVRDEWLGYGLSTEPADRERTVAGIGKAYTEAGLPAPPIVVWLDSPLAGSVGAVYLTELLKRLAEIGQTRASVRDSVRDSVWASVRDSVRDSVRASVRASVWDSVGASVGDSVRDSVWASVRDSVRDSVRASVRASVWDSVGASVGDSVRDSVGASVGASVGDSVGASVRDSVWDSVRDSVWDSVGDQFNTCFWGQHEAGWLAWIDYFRQAIPEIPKLERLIGLTEVAKSAGWCWLYRGAVVLTERPNELHRDAQGRLHSTNSMAIRYPDGWGMWAVSGVRVDEQVVMAPETLKVEQILANANSEVRRVMCERYGWERFTTDASLRMVDECPDPGNAPNTLKLFDLPDSFQVFGTPVRLLLCTNATPERDGTIRQYGLTTPAEIDHALSAAAWGASMTAKEYKQLARAT